MTTIGAKEFRLNMDDVLDRVLAGEDIVLKHRFKEPVRLLATNPANNKQSRARLDGLRAFDAAPKKPSPFDPNKSIKELYHESMAKKYGIS